MMHQITPKPESTKIFWVTNGRLICPCTTERSAITGLTAP